MCATSGQCNGKTQFEVAAKTQGSDRVCDFLTECSKGQYIKTPHTASTDRVCGDCDPEAPNFEYQNLENQAKCKAVSFCGDDEKVAQKANAYDDLRCGPCLNGFSQPLGRHREPRCVEDGLLGNATLVNALITTPRADLPAAFETVFAREIVRMFCLLRTDKPASAACAKDLTVSIKAYLDAKITRRRSARQADGDAAAADPGVADLEPQLPDAVWVRFYVKGRDGVPISPYVLEKTLDTNAAKQQMSKEMGYTVVHVTMGLPTSIFNVPDAGNRDPGADASSDGKGKGGDGSQTKDTEKNSTGLVVGVVLSLLAIIICLAWGVVHYAKKSTDRVGIVVQDRTLEMTNYSNPNFGVDGRRRSSLDALEVGRPIDDGELYADLPGVLPGAAEGTYQPLPVVVATELPPASELPAYDALPPLGGVPPQPPARRGSGDEVDRTRSAKVSAPSRSIFRLNVSSVVPNEPFPAKIVYQFDGIRKVVVLFKVW